MAGALLILLYTAAVMHAIAWLKCRLVWSCALCVSSKRQKSGTQTGGMSRDAEQNEGAHLRHSLQ